MIIKALCEIVLFLLKFDIFFTIPKLPEEVFPYLDKFFDYIAVGGGVLSNYVPLDYIMTLFGISLFVEMSIGVYHFIMWVLNKIPAIDID